MNYIPWCAQLRPDPGSVWCPFTSCNHYIPPEIEDGRIFTSDMPISGALYGRLSQRPGVLLMGPGCNCFLHL